MKSPTISVSRERVDAVNATGVVAVTKDVARPDTDTLIPRLAALFG
ncbi:MAG: hypothetical protein U9O54_06950 [Chloroflexota bacterium]|nr:hypothetical protein [Chloroflexota bacterium]